MLGVDPSMTFYLMICSSWWFEVKLPCCPFPWQTIFSNANGLANQIDFMTLVYGVLSSFRTHWDIAFHLEQALI